ncbi:MAG: glycosyltransferase family 2 protein [Chitinophagaceae bacterium]|nr:glycosyltransferase family 2 protein [Chitinophagaceae bacterium]
MQLSVIIVSYNVCRLLEQCLSSVLRSMQGISGEIIVIDNHSADETKNRLPPLFPKVQFVFNDQNRGFATACNQALSLAKGKYILFLNPDTTVTEDCFGKCIAFLEQNPEAGALGVHMVDEKGKFLKESRRAFPTPLVSFFKLFGLTGLFPSSPLFARYYMGHLPENKIHETEVLAGAFMMVRREALNKTGGFDERFFMYGEDIDLSWRLIQAGYKNYYFPETTIVHYKGGSTVKNKKYYDRFFGAMKLFVKKYYAKNPLFMYFLLAGIEIRKQLSLFVYFLRKIIRKKFK